MKYVPGARTAPPLDYLAAKAHLKLDEDDERAYVLQLIDDVADSIERDTASTIGTRTVTATAYIDDFHEGQITLRAGPVRSVASCVDRNSIAVPFELRQAGKDDYLYIEGVPAFPLTITYTAGHDPIPGPLRRVLLHQLAESFDRRSVASSGRADQPWIDRMLALYRRGAPVG